MKNLKILFLTHKFYPDIGGIEINSEILAKYFHKAGAEVRVLTWTKERGSKIFPFSIIRNPDLQQLFTHHYWADIVYENNPCIRLSWPAFFLKKTSVIALRTWIKETGKGLNLNNKLKLLSLKRAAAVIAVSNSVKNKSWPASVVISNPYRADLFEQLPNSIREFDFVFLGRLVPDKGADMAINAVQQLLNSSTTNRNLKLSIIGDGPQKEQLLHLVNRSGLQNNVVFTGALQGSALVECLNKHKFLLVPSLWEEPFGNVALEGMACGCIPIVSNGGGLPDAVGDAGLTFERGNLKSLVEKVQNLLANPVLERQLRDAAGKHLYAHHPDKIAEKYLMIIKSAANF